MSDAAVPTPPAPEPAGPTPPPDLRLDPLTRRSTYVVGHRQSRPNLPAQGCPFCPGGLEAPDDYDVFWFPNRWPAMPDGRCEVVLYTSDHDAEFWTLGRDGARRVVDLWAERTAALGARDDVDYVLVFENRGPEVGATIAHPHGQIYAYDRVPPEPLRELLDGVLVPEDVDPALVVCSHGDWSAWVPDAASWPYELRVAPRSSVPDLVDPACDRDGLAATLVDALARLDQVFDAPMPYMLWIHQRPTDGGDWPGARVHVHVTPLYRSSGVQRFVAAAELGGGIYFNPVPPVDAAAALRSCEGA
jgi:UDPglucose--hexose-1-phosphate uridylyltransferase